MKRRTMAIIMIAFMGGILITSLVVPAIPGIAPQVGGGIVGPEGEVRSSPDQFCSTGPAQSGTYVTEYDIPSECVQPVAIAVGPDGLVWFAETAAGGVARFDPASERFVEFGNPSWPPGQGSMMWGLDHDSDGNVWYTEDAYSSIWRFSVDDRSYARIPYPATSENTLPQRLTVVGDDVIVNDFQGGKITFLSAAIEGTEVGFRSLPSPVPNSLAGGFDIDGLNNLWYTNWIFQQDGVLIKLDLAASGGLDLQEDQLISDYLETYRLPADLSTPNGLAVGGDGTVWIADTSSSLFFSFDPGSAEYTRYVTSDPPASTFGNSSGLIITPVSRPYWVDVDDRGRVVFNEQTANRIAVFEPATESLVEYLVPSKNPNWGDCGEIADCGLAQIFGFDIAGDKVWFTEWAENKIGVVDTSVPLPFQVSVEPATVSARAGEEVQVRLVAVPAAGSPGGLAVSLGNPSLSDLSLSHDGIPPASGATVTIRVGDGAEGEYKVLVGAHDDEVAVSQYVTLTVAPDIP